jgi:hypothetical protein
MTDEPIDSIQVRDGKEVAFYGAVVTAWIGTRMEFDKSLLMMSLAGIGVVITLLTAVGMPTKLVVGAFLVSTVAFAGVLLLCLAIFWFNATFLEDLASGGGSNGDRRTRLLDRWGMGLFAVGVVSAIVAGGAAAIHKYKHHREPASATGAAPAPPAGRQSSDHLPPGPVSRPGGATTNGTPQSRPSGAAPAGATTGASHPIR